SFDHLGETYAPLRRLVDELARREYAGRVYAFNSGSSFNLTSAPGPCQSSGHDEVGIEYNPERGVFEIGYIEWRLSTCRARHRTAESRICAAHEVGEVIDRHVRKLVPAWRPVAAEPSIVESALLLMMFGGMFAFLLFWSLMWTGLEVGRLALASMGVVGTA